MAMNAVTEFPWKPNLNGYSPSSCSCNRLLPLKMLNLFLTVLAAIAMYCVQIEGNSSSDSFPNGNSTVAIQYVSGTTNVTPTASSSSSSPSSSMPLAVSSIPDSPLPLITISDSRTTATSVIDSVMVPSVLFPDRASSVSIPLMHATPLPIKTSRASLPQTSSMVIPVVVTTSTALSQLLVSSSQLRLLPSFLPTVSMVTSHSTPSHLTSLESSGNITSSTFATFLSSESLLLSSTVYTPSPTTVRSTRPALTTPAQPDELSILEWFGIAVGGAAVVFILFLVYHCHQVRQKTLEKQKKATMKGILDFSQSNRNDRISSWRNSMALDAMATHIELPPEQSVDMQSSDNLGFVDVFLGDEEPRAANNHPPMPQTNL